jgi:hypothetical protein
MMGRRFLARFTYTEHFPGYTLACMSFVLHLPVDLLVKLPNNMPAAFVRAVLIISQCFH